MISTANFESLQILWDSQGLKQNESVTSDRGHNQQRRKTILEYHVEIRSNNINTKFGFN